MKAILSAVLITLFCTACSLSPLQEKRTGFFSDYASLEKSPSGQYSYTEVFNDANISAYGKILVPEIRVVSNTLGASARENVLYTQIAAYTTAAYRKNIMKNSANYELVDVAQEGAIIMEIAISAVEVHFQKKGWDNFKALPFSVNEQTRPIFKEGNVRLLIEARATDAIIKKPLVYSMRIISDEALYLHKEHLQFNDLQPALDKWLNEAIVKH